MRGLVEIPAFGAVALGAHLALFAGWSGGAPESAGDGGDAVLTLQGASGAVETMVASWDRAPEVTPAPHLAEVTPRPETGARIPSEVAPPKPGERVAALSEPSRDASLAETDPPAAMTLADPEIGDAPSMAAIPTVNDAPPRVSAPEESRLASRPAAPPPAEPARQAPPAVDDAPAELAPATRPKARPQQVAQGSGGQGARGSRAETSAPSLSDSARRSIVASWGAEIRARIEARKVHPAGLRATGRPVVRITVARDGQLQSVSIARSSRVASLDEAALRAVRRAGRFPAAPGGLDLASVSFDLPISFTR